MTALPNKSETWSTGLFSCFSDLNSCCLSFFCCPCVACTTTAAFGEPLCLPLLDMLSPAVFAACGIPLCVPPANLSLRSAVRTHYGIKGSLCDDIVASCCCTCCSWCQIARELNIRMNKPVVISLQPQ